MEASTPIIESTNPNSPNSPMNSTATPPNLSSNSIIILTILISTKLTRTNYLAWKSQVEPLLYGYNLHKFLTASPPPQQITVESQRIENPEFHQWCQQDQMLLGWLRSSLSDTILSQVVSCTSSSLLWTNLQQTFSGTSRAWLTELKRNLQTTSKGSSSCTDYLYKMRTIADELSFIVHPVSDDDMAIHILTSLGPKYNAFVTSATTRSSQENIPLLELQALLLSHEKLLHPRSVANPLI